MISSAAMRMVADYLELALQFERLAAAEKVPEIKAAFEEQAAAYHNLAAKRAKKVGMPESPRTLENSNRDSSE
jgi:hypothetical protein